MNGAQSLLQTAVAGGVEVCFANPGTTEMHLVDALDRVSGVRAVLGLFEGVVTGAADGYGRMADKPALTLLHLGPGFANGIANLHNARRARTPIVNLIGHHATWQRNYDPPLNSDVETLAAPVSGWQRTSASADELARDVAEAVAASRIHPGQIATLVVPGDCQWEETHDRVVPIPGIPGAQVAPAAVESAAAAIRQGSALILLGGHGVRQRGLKAAGRIAKGTGTRLASETFAARMERGPHVPAVDRVPYFPEQAGDFFAGVSRVVLAGALDPVAFFGYKDGRRRMLDENVEVVTLATPLEDTRSALEALADLLEVGNDFDAPSLERPPSPTGPLSPSSIAYALAAHLPENAIVVDEGVTSAGGFYPVTKTAPAHTYLNLTGGAIGWGLPCSAGAAIACPDRKVITLEGDGSGLYTVQALWTIAREGLDVVSVVFANDLYRILQVELTRSGVEEPGPQSLALTELAKPTIDWVSLATGMGVPAESVTTAEELSTAFEAAIAEDGPRVIEVKMSGGEIATP